MESLSLALKILSALSLLAGLVQVLAGFLGVKLFDIQPHQLKLVGVALLALAAVLGTADYWTGKAGKSEPVAGDGGIQIGDIESYGGPVVVGPKGDVNINQTIDRLEIHPGDSPAEKARKRAQAQRIVAQEILANIRSLDQRLAVLDTILEPDTTGARLDDIRRRLAPALQHSRSEGYDKLIAEQKAASLQQAFNSAPLRTDQGEAMVRLLQETETDPAPVRRFNNALEQARYASDQVVEALRAPATAPSVSDESLRKENEALQAEQLALAAQGLMNRSRIAYLYGLVALNTLDQDRAALQADLAALTRLEPRRPASQAEAEALLAEVMTQEEARLKRKSALLDRHKSALERELGAYAEIDRQLVIEPGDPWNTVVAKAVSLRQLGRTGEAAAAFARYGEMFKAQDPGAERYARTAQKFTLAMKRLGVDGGVYVFAIKDGGPLARAGLAVGDIIIGYGGRPVSNMVEMTQTLADIPFGREVRIAYLRIDPQAQFVRREAVTAHGDPLAGLMPI